MRHSYCHGTRRLKTGKNCGDAGMRKIVTTNKCRQLYDILKADIMEGKYRPGDRLPSIRELSSQYELSKNTVNTVIAMLVNDGFACVKEGKGTYVGNGIREIKMIGVMLLDFCTGFRVELDILKHIQTNLPANYYLSLMNTADRYDTFCEGIKQLVDMRAAGFLIVPPKGQPGPGELEMALQLLHTKPTVMINRTIDGLEADVFSMNLGKGIEKSLEYLNAIGREKTAIVLHDSPKFLREELKAYESCSKRYNRPLRPEWAIDWSSDARVIGERIKTILPDIDSIIAPDNVLIQLNDMLSRCGKRIPQDLSLIGINDTTYSRMFHPPLTSIAFPVERVGKSAIEKLVGRIEGTDHSPYKFVNFEPELIIRNT